ncbi:hypothetical protein [Marinobacter alexandrii]|uniref:hypothetical protein n=1 Tax=Marinobacter alexandrii TaxID=2570351 RepID=UPI0011099FE3|nr:hypothetical protein [Marinobacter alexandrii]
MNPTLYDLLLVALSALFSWFMTHRYYLKSLQSQEVEASKQIAELSKAVESANAHNDSVLKNQYIEGALAAWKRKGQAVDYLNSLTDVTNETKAEILRSACLRHKGREPKNNPFLADE